MIKKIYKNLTILLLLSFTSLPAVSQVLWSETFTPPDPASGSTVDNGATKWSTTQPPNGTFATGNVLGSDVFNINNTDGEGVWVSESIDITATGYAIIDIDVGAGFTGAGDYCRVYVNDGTGDVLIYEVLGSFIQSDATGTGVVTGSSVVITVRASNDGSAFGLDTYTLDNITVTAVTTLYSRKTGNWNDATPGNGTWSANSLGGASCDCIPSNTTRVEIGNSNTVSINVAASVPEVNVLNTGVLQWTSVNDLSLRGDLNVNTGGSVSKNGNNGVQIVLGFIIPYNFDIDGTLATGILSIDDAATVTIDNDGTVTLEEVELNNDDASIIITNDGTMNIDDFDLNGAGTVELAGGSDIGVTDDILFGDDTNFTNNNTGTVTIGDEINFESITGNNSGVLLNNGTMVISNRIFIDDDDPSVTNAGIMTITNNIEVQGGGDDNWDFTNTGPSSNILTFNALDASNSNFIFDNDATIVMSGNFTSMSGTESIRNNTGGVWNYGGNSFSAAVELYCDVNGVNSFVYSRSGTQDIVTPQDSYWDLTLSGSGAKSLQGAINVKGDYTISDGTSVSLTPGTNRVTLNGSVAQTINITSNPNNVSLYDLTVNNTSGLNPSVVVGGNVNYLTVTNNLTLTQGVVDTESAISGFYFNPGSTLTGSDADSYIDGPVAKEGNSAFEFPTGDGNIWAPIAISAPVPGPGNAGDIFTSQYFDAGYPDVSTDGTFDHISGSEYWTLDRSGTDANDVTVTLFWKDDSRSEITDLADLLVARYNTGATQWESEGQSANSGTITPAGSVTSNTVTTFSPFTFGSLNGNNPLPVTLVSFSAYQEQESVALVWETSLEINNDYFALERSWDGIEFQEISRTSSKGNSHSSKTTYIYNDYPSRSGLIYYRLSQFDFDGSAEVFKIISINYQSSQKNVIVYPNPLLANEMHVILPGDDFETAHFVLFSLEGTVVMEKEINEPSREIHLQFGLLRKGLYILKVATDAGNYHTKVYIE